MEYIKRLIEIILLSICIYSPVTLVADDDPNAYHCVVESEFANTPILTVPLAVWEFAGCSAINDSIYEFDITAVPDTVYNITTMGLIPNAMPGDGYNDYLSFFLLIEWIENRDWYGTKHARIVIPEGEYDLFDQIVMGNNISLRGAGSDQTILRFAIKADSTNMNQAACRKDAILISGSDILPQYRIYNVGIENLKIVRIREGLTPEEVKYFVGDHQTINGILGYYGNNIAIRYGQNCWVKGVESENTFRNHVTLEFSYHITISGVYFHHANNYGGGGYGYGVGIWDSSNNKVENSIFEHLRHGVTIIDKSWFNVIAYNYFRDQHSVAELPVSTMMLPFPDEIEQKWSDIAVHGESHNTWQSEDNPSVPIDSLRTPYYNLIEGNELEYLCVDATHQHNGSHNTFLRNRVTNQIHVMGYDGFPAGFTETIIACDAVIEAVCFLFGSQFGWDVGFYIAYGLTNVALQFVCKDCASFRMADQFTYLNPGTDNDTHKFQNQPRQLFVNNYAREYNWWRNQILDFPVRMHSETDQFQINTYKRYLNFFGKKKGKVLSEYTPAYVDGSYYHDQEIAPEYWPNTMAWPYYTSQEGNPASYRWHNSNKKTFGPGDPAGFYSITTISSNTTFAEDQDVAAGTILVINPGVTIKFETGKKLTINGSLRALGTEELPIVFTCSDSSQTWYGITVAGTNEAALPNIELSNCTISKVSAGALTMYQYQNALIVFIF